MRFGIILSVITALAGLTSAFAADCYVSPDGNPDNSGSAESPWDLASTLLGERAACPGDTVWINGGTYKHPARDSGTGYVVKLKGEEGKPIHVRALPGQRATIDGGMQVVAPSEYLWLWDLEIMVSENLTMPRTLMEAGSAPMSAARPGGSLNVLAGKGCKFINLVIHDNAQGIGFWRGAIDSEVHGCVIYDNGWVGADRWHGPGIYTQNERGTKLITDNLIFQNYSLPLQAYGSETAYVNDYQIEGNVVFAPRIKGGRTTFQVAGGRPSKGIVVRGNILHPCPMLMGYAGKDNEDLMLEANTVLRSGISVNFKYATQRDNVVWNGRDAAPEPFVVLRRNKYDPSRANLALFNPEQTPTMQVDLSGFLSKGDKFRIHDPRQLFGEPIIGGVYTGRPVAVPIPTFPDTPEHEFAALVVFKEVQRQSP